MKREARQTKKERKALRSGAIHVARPIPVGSFAERGPGDQALLLLAAACPGILEEELRDAGALVIAIAEDQDRDPRAVLASLLNMRATSDAKVDDGLLDAETRHLARGILRPGLSLEEAFAGVVTTRAPAG